MKIGVAGRGEEGNDDKISSRVFAKRPPLVCENPKKCSPASPMGVCGLNLNQAGNHAGLPA